MHADHVKMLTETGTAHFELFKVDVRIQKTEIYGAKKSTKKRIIL